MLVRLCDIWTIVSIGYSWTHLLGPSTIKCGSIWIVLPCLFILFTHMDQCFVVLKLNTYITTKKISCCGAVHRLPLGVVLLIALLHWEQHCAIIVVGLHRGWGISDTLNACHANFYVSVDMVAFRASVNRTPERVLFPLNYNSKQFVWSLIWSYL